MSESNQCRFLTCKEAALSASVGEETILKYKELGLLRSFRVNGQEQYREDEIKLIFNSKKKFQAKQNSPHVQTEKIKLTSQNAQQPSEELPTLSEILAGEILARETLTSEILTEDRLAENSSQHITTKEQVDNSKQLPNDDQQASYPTEFVKNRENTQESAVFDIPSIELLELTRSLKDQLEMIKEERNWLRRRVEKLESSIEREQMLAISKTETIRNLIDHTKTQKKSWSFFLPWNKSNELTNQTKKRDQ